MVSRKKYHDKSITCHKVEVGDLVLLRDKRLKSDYKIADKWEAGVYEVVSKKEESPVFTIRHLSNGAEQTIHRNMIHPARSVVREGDLVVERVTALAKANQLMDQMFQE